MIDLSGILRGSPVLVCQIAALFVAGCAQTLIPSEAVGMSSGTSGARVASFFEGTVSDIVSFEPLQFTLDCCEGRLELGMADVRSASEASRAAIAALLSGRELSCTAFSEAPRSGSGPDNFVWCNTTDGTLLSSILIERGLATERCEFSGNQFGTC